MPLTSMLRAIFATKKPQRSAPRRRLGLEALEQRWCPAGGQLDPTFGFSKPSGNFISMVAEPDGKIVDLGTFTVAKSGGTVQVWTIERLNANGSLDTSFNGTGQVNLPSTVAGLNTAAATSLAVQPDGKILVGFNASKSSSGKIDSYFAVARFNSNGSLDTSFGTNSGYWLFNPQPVKAYVPTEVANKLALLGDGSIMVGGPANASDGVIGFAAVKLTPSGHTDTTFGTGGMTVAHVGTGPNPTLASTMGMTVSPTGEVILSGFAQAPGATFGQGCLVVLTASGHLDTGFNGTGYVIAAEPGGAADSSFYCDVAVQGNNIVAAGRVFGGTGLVKTQGLVARYTMSGALDTTFAQGGYYFSPTFPTIGSLFNQIEVAPDGSLLVGGKSYFVDANNAIHYGFQVTHLLADGTADANFGTHGNGIVSETDAPQTAGTQFTSMALGSDGSILLGTTVTDTSGQKAKMFRFTGW